MFLEFYKYYVDSITSTMWTLLKLRPIDKNTYDQIQNAILPY